MLLQNAGVGWGPTSIKNYHALETWARSVMSSFWYKKDTMCVVHALKLILGLSSF